MGDAIVQDLLRRTGRRPDCRPPRDRRGLRAHELIDPLLTSPWTTTQRAKNELGVTNTGATNLLKRLEAVGILDSMPRVPGRSNRWVAREAMSAVRDDFDTDTE